MQNVLIAGANGGIGRAMLEQLAARSAALRLFATHRRPLDNPLPAGVTPLPMDYAQTASVSAVAQTVARECAALDTLIVATGSLHGDFGGPEKSMAQLETDTMQTVYLENAAGPLTLLAACERSLKNAEEPRVIFLSAQVGSIGDNGLGGWYSYRMAKAALNMGVKTAAIEASRWRNEAAIVAVHPGTTTTALSEPFIARRKSPVSSAAATAERILALHDRLTGADNGAFLTSRGEPLPW